MDVYRKSDSMTMVAYVVNYQIYVRFNSLAAAG